MRKSWKIMAAIVSGALFIGGCGKEAPVQESKEGMEQMESVPQFSIGLRTSGIKYVESSPDINKDEHVLAFEEKMGVDLDISLISHDGFSEKLGMMLAQGEFPDCISGDLPYTPVMSGAIESGLFMPLDDLLEEYAPRMMETIPEETWDELRGEDGKIYAIGDYMSSTARRATVIRKDLLDECGLEIPVTLEDYYNTLVAFKEHGVKYPFCGRENFTYSETFFAAYGVVPTTWQLNEEGEVVPAYLLPEMKEALAFYKKLYDEGLMDPESLTNNMALRDQKVAVGDVGMFVANIVTVPEMNTNLQSNVPEGELICIPSPLNPNGGKHGYAAVAPTANVHYINADCENPEDIIQFFDKMLDPELETFLTYGIEGEFYTLNDDGSINYTPPTESDSAFNVIPYFLRRIKDAAIDRPVLLEQPGGEKVIEYFEKEAAGDILEYILPVNLESLEKHPELTEELFWNYASKVVVGAESLDHFDSFVQEWMDREGTEVVREATEQYESGRTKTRK